MAMFRVKSKSAPDRTHFGVGSIVRGNKEYLVIGQDTRVALCEMSTFEIVSRWREVDDPNWLTEAEARDLIDHSIGNELQWTFTDFDLIPQGNKK